MNGTIYFLSSTLVEYSNAAATIITKLASYNFSFISLRPTNYIIEC